MRLNHAISARRVGAALAGLAAVLVSSVFAASAFAAADGEGLVVVPRPARGGALSYFKITAGAGRSTNAGTIGLVNRGRGTLHLRVSSVSGATINTLGSAYGAPGSKRRGAATWMRLSTPALTLPPRSTATVQVTVAVPPHASAGDARAGIGVEAVGAKQDTGGRGVAIASAVRYVIGVEVTVPGPRRPLIQFTGASVERQPATLAFILDARNAGNVILQHVHGAALITSGHRRVASVPLGPGTFVTSSSIAYPVVAPRERPRLGTVYRVRAYMRYGQRVARLDTLVRFGRAAVAQQRAYSPGHSSRNGSTLPVWLWALLAGALLYGAATTVLIVRKRRQAPTSGTLRSSHPHGRGPRDVADSPPLGDNEAVSTDRTEAPRVRQ